MRPSHGASVSWSSRARPGELDSSTSPGELDSSTSPAGPGKLRLRPVKFAATASPPVE